jgi:uncharacterized membrane protein
MQGINTIVDIGNHRMAITCHSFGPLLADASADSWAGLGLGFLSLLALLVGSIGIAGIVWGAYSAVVRQIAAEAGAAQGQASRADTPPGRPVFFGYLLAGLEFLIAGCLIKTLAAPDWQQACVLASLVLARTLLGLSARWEGSLGLAGSLEKAAAPAAPLQALGIAESQPPALPEVSEGSGLVAASAPR